jgi:hypothetical protein
MAPSADVPSTIARFVGVWEGAWSANGDGTGPGSALIVQSITTTRATTVYVFGSAAPVEWSVEADGSLQQAGNIAFVWTLSSDGRSLSGVRSVTPEGAREVLERSGLPLFPAGVLRTTMTRCSPPA